jgi:hypothetical protein
MIIEVGKLYENKTLKYLVPALRIYGETFKAKVNLVYKIAFGISDSLLEGSYLEGQPNLFMLVDRTVYPNNFNNFTNWIKTHESYVTDYPYGSELDARFHMFVLAFPPHLGDAYSKFLDGRYSKMYTKDEIEFFFEGRESTKTVLTKRISAIPTLLEKISHEFGENLSYEEVKGFNEYDLPPKKEEEFFNYININQVFI